jgi:hypothetical protein
MFQQLSRARVAFGPRSKMATTRMLRSLPTRVCCLLLATLTSAASASTQSARQGQALTLPAGKDSIVRFFYQPPGGEYFHVALLFRVVEKKDVRWNTAPVFDEGRTAYISLSDMQRLMGRMAHLSLQWDQSPTIESLETYKTIHSYGYGMGVKVLSANGTAKSLIAHDKICETLAQLDGALLTPRALWEFQGFRLQYHCRVPGYNPDAYPDRVP